MMKLTKYFPTPSDRMGFLWTLTSISECYVIEFGPAGTTHFAIEGVMELGAEHKMQVFTTHMSEVDITFGRHDKLTGAILEVDRLNRPGYIFVMASSVSALIGIDIESICRLLQDQVTAVLIPVEYGGYDGDYNLGVERALLCLAQNIVKESVPKANTYNLIGSNIDCYQFQSDRAEMERILWKTFGLQCNTCFTAYTSIAEIQQASQAACNIVLRREGVKCAEWMQSAFGIPYVYKKPYGPAATLSWLLEIAQRFDRELDLDYVTANIEEIRRYLSQYQMYLRKTDQKQVLIYAEYDTAVGMGELLEELGLERGTIYIKHGVQDAGENIMANPSETKLKEAILQGNYAVFGEDSLRKLYIEEKAKNPKLDQSRFFQIANPSMEQYSFYPGQPLVGFRGTLRMLQELMNFERRKSRNSLE